MIFKSHVVTRIIGKTLLEHLAPLNKLFEALSTFPEKEIKNITFEFGNIFFNVLSFDKKSPLVLKDSIIEDIWTSLHQVQGSTLLRDIKNEFRSHQNRITHIQNQVDCTLKEAFASLISQKENIKSNSEHLIEYYITHASEMEYHKSALVMIIGILRSACVKMLKVQRQIDTLKDLQEGTFQQLQTIITMLYKHIRKVDAELPINLDVFNKFPISNRTIRLTRLSSLDDESWVTLKNRIKKDLIDGIAFESETEFTALDFKRLEELLPFISYLNLTNVFPYENATFLDQFATAIMNCKQMKLKNLNLSCFLDFCEDEDPENKEFFKALDLAKHKLLAALGKNTVIETLNLGGCALTDVHLVSFLKTMTDKNNYRTLYLNDNCLTSEGLKQLAKKFSVLNHLRKLDLEENNYFFKKNECCISEGLHFLLQSILAQKNSDLTYLNLSKPCTLIDATFPNEIYITSKKIPLHQETLHELCQFLSDPRCKLETFKFITHALHLLDLSSSLEEIFSAITRNQNSAIHILDFTGSTLLEKNSKTLSLLLQKNSNITSVNVDFDNPSTRYEIEILLDINKIKQKGHDASYHNIGKLLKLNTPDTSLFISNLEKSTQTKLNVDYLDPETEEIIDQDNYQSMSI